MNYILKLLVITMISGNAFAGLLDMLDPNHDFSLGNLLKRVIGALNSTTNAILKVPANPIETDINFLCGNRNSPNFSRTVIADSSLSTKIVTSKPIVFIIHGWIHNGDMNWIKSLATDYLTHVDTNICVVDWGKLSLIEYTMALNNTYIVGDYVAKFITYLNGQGIPLTNVTMVGHSLGAHICGQTGKSLGGKIGAIYGLDPAGPLLRIPFDVGVDRRLDSSDALYVQMIITARCLLGVCFGDGHENFYPSGGFAPQPNCIITLSSNSESVEPTTCSHLHAYSLFQMALNPKNVFNGKKCSSFIGYLAGLCAPNDANKMGIYSSRIGGDFFLLTSSLKPYTM